MKILGYEISVKKKPKPGDPLTREEREGKTASHAGASTTPDQVKEDLPSMPTKGGRSSVPVEAMPGVNGLLAEFATIEPDFPVKLLEVMEKLAMYNDDFSYAVDNIVQLGNTDYSLEFDDSVTPEDAVKMNKYIKNRLSTWYNYSEGVSGLVNDLLAQMAVFGCISAEAIPHSDLSGVKRVVLVAPKNIRFKYNKSKDTYDAFQQVDATQLGARMNVTGLVKLNPITYKYYAIRRYNDKPYAIPPFMTALESIAIEKDMLCGFKNIIKRFGLMGFLEVLVNAPTKMQGENDDTFRERSKRYLTEAAAEVEKGMTKGYVVGYKDRATFTMQNTSQGAEDANKLFEMNLSKKFAGLKQDPIMLGRNFSTTETIGRVLLAKLGTQVVNFQRGVSTFLGDVAALELLMAGFRFGYAKWTFKKPLIGDNLRDAQTYKQEIENADLLYNQGVISQEQRAQILGYEEPDQDKPRAQPGFSEDGVPLAPAGGDTEDPKDPTDPKSTDVKSNEASPSGILYYARQLGAHHRQFDYDNGACCEHHGRVSLDHYLQSLGVGNSDDKETEFLKKYLGETQTKYSKAVKSIARTIVNGLRDLGNGATEGQVRDNVFFNLYRSFKGAFSDKQKGTVNKWVSSIYDFFRKDKNVFAGHGDIPAPQFQQADWRAIDYFKRSDQFYLGKFITDPDVSKDITAFIKKAYLEGIVPIGDKIGTVAAFRDQFADVLQGQDWKVLQIVTTTVNKLRNYAHINYLQQAGIERFVVRGVNDQLQCKYCSSIQGKSFQVSVAFDKVDNVVASEPEFVKADAPFITSVYKKPEDMADLTADELQASGIDVPPYHPSCRDRIVADI